MGQVRRAALIYYFFSTPYPHRFSLGLRGLFSADTGPETGTQERDDGRIRSRTKESK